MIENKHGTFQSNICNDYDKKWTYTNTKVWREPYDDSDANADAKDSRIASLFFEKSS